MVLQTQVADAAELFLQTLLLGQPGVLVIELIAQAIQQRIHSVVDEPAFAEGERRSIHQGMANGGCQFSERRVGWQQRLQNLWPSVQRSLQATGQSGQAFQPIGDGHQVAGAGMTGAGSTRQPFQISHGPEQPTQALAQGPLVHQQAYHALPFLDGLEIHQWCFQPAAQTSPTHGGQGLVDGPEQ